MEETHTLERNPVRVIRLPGVPANTNANNYYFPINLDQVRDLEEALYDRIEMLSLSKKAEDAAKVVFQEKLWQWFADAQDNSTTSYRGCIAPVIVDNHKDSEFYPSNRWGYNTEQDWLNAQPRTENPLERPKDL